MQNEFINIAKKKKNILKINIYKKTHDQFAEKTVR